MADHHGETDPRKIAALPADILLHWQAFYKLRNKPDDDKPVNIHPSYSTPQDDSIEEQCVAVIRALL
ncbi:hypothetical protein B5C26_00900 [Photorhabdus luminescens]|uniref:hypothetical protein n=1 Tax=Photorhabdus luminescens TaxID=29488 RepID=UPI000B69C883|nr:hypothetical protein [Photorhabdus luminescens]OWO86536.1 hypothetical protein B5C26_00900 [Photorhabdus luminescens]